MTKTYAKTLPARPDAGIGPLAALLAALALLAAIVLAVSPAAAQGPFSAAARVNGDVVTYYEVSQRQRLLEVLNASAEARAGALDTLIDERLQVQAAERAGFTAGPDQIEEEVAAFAGRAQLSPEQFINNLSAAGVAPETFRDFIASAASWRNLVRARFGPRASVTPDEIERALAAGNIPAGQRINIAELIMPATDGTRDLLMAELTRLSNQVDGSFERFSDAARRFSAAETRDAGGVTGWRPVSALPPALVALMLRLEVGEVSDPIPLGGAIALFQLRGIEDVVLGAPDVASVDFLTVPIPGGRTPDALAEAARLRGAVDTCDDFYGVLPGGFERQTSPVSALPQDIAVALSRLDDDEMSTDVTRGNGQVLLLTMLCGRELSASDEVRRQVEGMLVQRRIEGYAGSFLSELRAEAIISYTDG